MTTSRSSYIARINRVFDHIDANLAEPLDLERLAAIGRERAASAIGFDVGFASALPVRPM